VLALREGGNAAKNRSLYLKQNWSYGQYNIEASYTSVTLQTWGYTIELTWINILTATKYLKVIVL
jgi:hypothetical protein